jgi:nitrate reductase (NAD(P)H)
MGVAKKSDGGALAASSLSAVAAAPRSAAYVALAADAPAASVDEKRKADVFKQYGVDAATEFDNEVPNKVDDRDQGTPDDWIPRRKEMLRLTSLHPFNSEAPLQTLMDAGFLTPTALHYVRNHGPVPKLSWETHQIEFEDIHGNTVGSLSMAELTTLFPQRTLPVSLSCAGNRRKEANLTKQSKGFSWGCAAVSTSIWTGVRLAEVLGHFGLLNDKDLAETNYVCFDGVDTLPNGTYGTSVAVGTVLDPAREVLLCWEQNGTRLTPDHGYPVRLLVPGFIGGRSIKWLGKVKMSSSESESWYHYFDNRLPPPNVDQEVVKHDDSWFKKPEYIINDRSINSAVSSPQHGEVLVLADAPKEYALKGYAYNGGGRRITRVEVTLDNGATWELADMTQPEQPTPFGRYWCWTFWQLNIDPMLLLQAKEICCRAWDESTNSQPGKSTWSILGMMQNGWFRVKVSLHTYVWRLDSYFWF